MQKLLPAVVIAIFAMACRAHASPTAITKEQATRIALNAAHCKTQNSCVAHGMFQNGKWVFVISFVTGHDSTGKPMFTPGAWTGISISPEGQVLEKVPGA